ECFSVRRPSETVSGSELVAMKRGICGNAENIGSHMGSFNDQCVAFPSTDGVSQHTGFDVGWNFPPVHIDRAPRRPLPVPQLDAIFAANANLELMRCEHLPCQPPPFTSRVSRVLLQRIEWVVLQPLVSQETFDVIALGLFIFPVHVL